MPRRQTGLFHLIVAGLLILLSWPALGHTMPTSSSWDRCLHEQATALHLDPALLRAIILTESNGHPWAIGWTDSRGYRHSVFPTNQEEAAHLISSLQRANRTFDTGLMQLNSIHFPRLVTARGLTPHDLLHPCTNIHLAGQILRENLERHGFIWRAIAGYNGSVGSTKYTDLVWDNLCRQDRSRACQTTAAAHAAQRPTPTDPLTLMHDPIPRQPAHAPMAAPFTLSVPAPSSPIRLPALTNIVLPSSTETPDHEPPTPPSSASTQESTMTLWDTVLLAMPATMTMMAFAFRILIPFLVLTGLVVLLAYGSRVMFWALGMAFDSVRTLLQGQRPSFPLFENFFARPTHETGSRTRSSAT
jgi:hypothetical protein